MRPVAQRGFTLVEVLVALTIVALCLGAGMRAAGALSSNAQRLEQVTLAQWCAQNQLTEMRLLKTFPGQGETSFSCEQLGQSFTGRLEVKATPNPNFRRIEARVLNDEGQSLLSISTIMGRY